MTPKLVGFTSPAEMQRYITTALEFGALGHCKHCGDKVNTDRSTHFWDNDDTIILTVVITCNSGCRNSGHLFKLRVNS